VFDVSSGWTRVWARDRRAPTRNRGSTGRAAFKSADPRQTDTDTELGQAAGKGVSLRQTDTDGRAAGKGVNPTQTDTDTELGRAAGEGVNPRQTDTVTPTRNRIELIVVACSSCRSAAEGYWTR